MIAVILEASIPSVTCSAVEADPKPLGPEIPVINLNIFRISIPTPRNINGARKECLEN